VPDLLLKPVRFDEEILRKRFHQALAIVKPHVVLMSHVEPATGFVMPVAKLVKDMELVAPRRDDFFILIDDAQGGGNVPTNDVPTAADFYVGCTQKWLGGDPTPGFLYSRKPQFDMRDPAQSYYLGATTGGAGNLNALASFNSVCDLWRKAPRFEYAARLIKTCRRDALGIDIVGRDWGTDYRSSIVTFRSADLTVSAVEENLRAKGYEVTVIVSMRSMSSGRIYRRSFWFCIHWAITMRRSNPYHYPTASSTITPPAGVSASAFIPATKFQTKHFRTCYRTFESSARSPTMRIEDIA
jgi:hypothetical protein